MSKIKFLIYIFFTIYLSSSILSKEPIRGEQSQNLLYLQDPEKILIAIHGGAGSYNRSEMSIEKEKEIKLGLFRSLKAGYDLLKRNNSSYEAVREAIIVLEDNPLFNAGKGGKLNRNFEVELDASIMRGSDLKVGAVAGLKHVKNPILAAEKVMMNTPHVLLVGKAADDFADLNNLTIVENSYFLTEERIVEWFVAKEEIESNKSQELLNLPKNKMGTIGAVALDSQGHLAAATSTGGITYKMAGRVGDSPITGAGNYANDKTCAISCTGVGEQMMRSVFAFDIHAKMKYKSFTLLQASKEIMSELPTDIGGFIAIDKNGNVEMPYNTSGMARAYVRQDGRAHISIFDEGEDFTPVEYDLDSDH